jgi:hypothetical protein
MSGRSGSEVGEGAGRVRRVLWVMRRFSLSASASPSCRVSSSMRGHQLLILGGEFALAGLDALQDGFELGVLAHTVLQEVRAVPVRRRLMTKVIAHRTREREEARHCS